MLLVHGRLSLQFYESNIQITIFPSFFREKDVGTDIGSDASNECHNICFQGEKKEKIFQISL